MSASPPTSVTPPQPPPTPHPQAPTPAKSVSPCQTGSKASTALLQAARQQLPLTQRSALQASSSSSRSVVKVATWQQLVDAVDAAAAGEPSAGWRVFELQPGSSLLASRTLQLQPGMAVVAAGAGQGRTAKVAVSCQQGVGSAFEVDLTSSSSNRWVVAQGGTKQQDQDAGCMQLCWAICRCCSKHSCRLWQQVTPVVHVCRYWPLLSSTHPTVRHTCPAPTQPSFLPPLLLQACCCCCCCCWRCPAGWSVHQRLQWLSCGGVGWSGPPTGCAVGRSASRPAPVGHCADRQ
jgi:hypothetical protein